MTHIIPPNDSIAHSHMSLCRSQFYTLIFSVIVSPLYPLSYLYI